MANIFEFESSVEILKRFAGNNKRSGFWQTIAKACDLSSTFVSQVISGNKQFNLEQADKIAEYLNFSKYEKEYWLLLIQKERSGTKSLKEFFEEKLSIARLKAHNHIKSHLNAFHELTPEEQAIYYSHWHYAVIHVAITIKDLRSAKSLSSFLGIDLEQVQKVLNFLLRVQLIEQNKDQYSPTVKLVHLGKDSHFLYLHHMNLRVKALQMLGKNAKASNYSVVVSLSERDALEFQKELLELSKKFMEKVRHSNEETLRVFIYDFFPLEFFASEVSELKL